MQVTNQGPLPVANVPAIGSVGAVMFALLLPPGSPAPDALPGGEAMPGTDAKPVSTDAASAIATTAPVVEEPAVVTKTVHSDVAPPRSPVEFSVPRAGVGAPHRPARHSIEVTERARLDLPLPVTIAPIVQILPVVPALPAKLAPGRPTAVLPADGFADRDQRVATLASTILPSHEHDQRVAPGVTVPHPVERIVTGVGAKTAAGTPTRVDPAATDDLPLVTAGLAVPLAPGWRRVAAPQMVVSAGNSPFAHVPVDDATGQPVLPVAIIHERAAPSPVRQSLSRPVVGAIPPLAAAVANPADLAGPSFPPPPSSDDLPLPPPSTSSALAFAPPPIASAVIQPSSVAPPSATAQSAGFAVDTPSLGSVGAEVTHREQHGGNALHVHFAVDRIGTAALITGTSDDLGRALAATGNRLDVVTVDVRAGASDASARAGDSSVGNQGVGNSGARGGGDGRRQPPAPMQSVPPPFRDRLTKAVIRDRFA